MGSLPRRKPGTGTLTQRKNGSWEIRWRSGRKGRGKICSRYFKTREEAEETLNSLIEAIRVGQGERNKSTRNRKNYRSRNEEIDSVYFIRPIAGGPVKIGKTRNMAARLREVQANSPALLEVLWVVSNAPQGLERQLHQKFAKYRLHGEWFEDGPEIQGYIAELQNQS